LTGRFNWDFQFELFGAGVGAAEEEAEDILDRGEKVDETGKVTVESSKGVISSCLSMQSTSWDRLRGWVPS